MTTTETLKEISSKSYDFIQEYRQKNNYSLFQIAWKFRVNYFKLYRSMRRKDFSKWYANDLMVLALMMGYYPEWKLTERKNDEDSTEDKG